MSGARSSALVILVLLTCGEAEPSVALVGRDEDLTPPKAPWHSVVSLDAWLRFGVHNNTAGALAVDRSCGGECVILERRGATGEWETRPISAKLDAKSLQVGSAEILSVLPTTHAWPPGDYRLTLRLRDASRIPLAVTREFTVNAWPAATVRTALRMLQASEGQACGDLDVPWSLLFDRADSACLVGWLHDARLRPRATRHLVDRGGHDAAVMDALDRYPDSLRPTLSGIRESEFAGRPLAAAAVARLIDELATSGGSAPDSHYDDYTIAKRFAKLWPAGTQARLVARLAVAPEDEVMSMLGGLFYRYWLFEGYEVQIGTVLTERCAGASEELGAVCNDALPLYGPMRELSHWSGFSRCDGVGDASLACDAMEGWDELVAGADEAPVVWRDGRVTHPSPNVARPADREP